MKTMLKKVVYTSTNASAILAASLLATNQVQGQEPAPAEKGWESSAAAGLTLTRGNSSTLLGTLSLQSSRKWEKDEVYFSLWVIINYELVYEILGWGKDMTVVQPPELAARIKGELEGNLSRYR